jgi:hypothetical protein
MTEKKEISWKSHPIVDFFPKSILAVIAVVGFSFLIGYAFANAGFGLIAFVILFLSMLTYFCPVYYHIDENTLTVQFLILTHKRILKEFRSYYYNASGVNFSTFSSPSPLDSFRGNFVRFNFNRDEVLAFLKDVFPKEEKSEE